jgi:hypothetical protein
MDLETIWQTAVDALHSGEKISRTQLDGYVRAASKGQINSFAELAHVRAQHQQTLGQNQVAQAGIPSPAATFAEGLANGAGLGIPEMIARHAGPSLPGAETMRDFMASGAENNPMADLTGNMAGGAIPAAIGGAIATPALEGLAAITPGLRALPGLARTAIAGGVAQAPVAGIQAATRGGSPGEIGTSMALATALGIPASAAAGWAATKMNPAEHFAGRAVQEATPGVPNFAAGKAALLTGETTPYRIGRPEAELTSTPMSEADIAKLPEVLRPMNFERSPSVRSLAAKRPTKSPEAATQLERAITQRIAKVIDAKKAIMEHPETGYNALLEGKIVENPDAISAFQQTTGASEPPTARQLFDLQKSLDKRVDAAWKAKARGGEFNFDKTEAQSETADLFRQTLRDEVDGFGDLQAEVAPYLNRQSELRGQLRSIIGRTIKPLGQTAEDPAGDLLEAIKEAHGAGKGQISEAAARRLVPALTSTNIQDLFDFIGTGSPLNKSLFKFKPGATTGAVSGGMGSKTKTGKQLRGIIPMLQGLVSPAELSDSSTSY